MRSRVSRVLGAVGIVASVLILCRASTGAVAGLPFEVIAGSLDNPRGLAFGPEGALYVVEAGRGSLLVLEIAKNSLLSGDPTGALIRLKPDGSRETLLSEGLVMPAAVAIGYDALVISNCGVCAGDGQVIRVILDKDE